MSWLRIFDFLDSNFFLSLIRSSEKDERRDAELEALSFIETQRVRRAEKENLKKQLVTLANLKTQSDVDPQSIKNIEEELALKERLLNSGTFSIERNKFNASILDAYEKECKDIQRIEELKNEIQKLEKEGKIGLLGPLQEEVREKESWLTKNVLGKLWPVQE